MICHSSQNAIDMPIEVEVEAQANNFDVRIVVVYAAWEIKQTCLCAAIGKSRSSALACRTCSDV